MTLAPRATRSWWVAATLLAALVLAGCSRTRGTQTVGSLDEALAAHWPEASEIRAAASDSPWIQHELRVAGHGIGRVVSRTLDAGRLQMRETRVERWLEAEEARWPWIDHRLSVADAHRARTLELRRLQQGRAATLWMLHDSAGGGEASFVWRQGGWHPCRTLSAEAEAGAVRMRCGDKEVFWRGPWEPGWPETLGAPQVIDEPPALLEDARWTAVETLRHALRVPVHVDADVAWWDAPRVRWRLDVEPTSGVDLGELCEDGPDRSVLERGAHHCVLRQMTSPSHALLRWGDALPDGAPPVETPTSAPAVRAWADDVLGREGETVRAGVLRAVALLAGWADTSVGVERLQPEEVLRMRRGSCLALSRLLADALRLRGIPARVELGLVPDGDGALVHHAWVAWWDGRWVSADPAHGLVPASPASLRLATWPTPYRSEDLSKITFRIVNDPPLRTPGTEAP